jgi:hypothetical protein
MDADLATKFKVEDAKAERISIRWTEVSYVCRYSNTFKRFNSASLSLVEDVAKGDAK